MDRYENEGASPMRVTLPSKPVTEESLERTNLPKGEEGYKNVYGIQGRVETNNTGLR